MFEQVTFTVRRYAYFYWELLNDQWADMTPIKYAALLAGIGVVGWLLMRKGPRGL